MAPNNLLYQYYCARCKSKLKESPVELAASPSDLCPQCGSFLTETLQRNQEGKSLQQQQQQAPPVLRTALDLAVPSFGIPRLDAIVGRFATSVCLTGPQIAEALFWRAIVRSLVPRRAGGSGFSKVLLIDAGNCSDIYLCVDYARQCGLSLDRLLDGIIVTRAFTVYQLAALARGVGQAARRFGADMIAMADMAKMFVTDPLTQKEEPRLAKKIAQSLVTASSQVPVMAFTGSFGVSDWLDRFDATIEAATIQQQNHQGQTMLSCRCGKSGEKKSVAISDSEVYLVGREEEEKEEA
jgi:DNA-directed RNA polymerase subunit RPC12/RpoP